MTPWRALVAIGCMYEIVALFTKIPTITQLTYMAKNRPALRGVVWLAAGASMWHFYVEGEMHNFVESD